MSSKFCCSSYVFRVCAPYSQFSLSRNQNYNIQTIKYRKSRIWEMKEDKYTKNLAKNQVCVIFDMQDIRENVLPEFIKLCMEMPYWCLFEGRKYGGQKPTETSVFELSNKSVNLLLEELTKIKVIFILRQRMFRLQNL